MASNWAIIIGINDYQHHPERRLKYAVNDAQRISDFLIQQGRFDESHVIRCLGDSTFQGSQTYPTSSNLLRLLKRDLHPNSLGKIDRIWFYFSGHGVSRNGRDYLITSDCLEDEIERFGLPIDEVVANLQLHQDADVVLILDACRQVLGKKSFDSSIGKQTIESAKERGITTIFSCDYGQYSYELEALQHGAFTYALIEELRQHTLPIQLENYLRQQVQNLHLKHQRNRVEQTPRIRVEPASKAFQSLLPDAVTSADIEVLISQAKESEIEEDFETAKKLWWQVIDVSQFSTQRQESRSAIERIDQKVSRINAHRSTEAKPLQIEPPQTSKSSEMSSNQISFPREAQQQKDSSSLPTQVAGDQTTGKGSMSNSSSVIGSNAFISVPVQDKPTPEPEMDYSTLQQLLKAQQWKEADHATYLLMLQVFRREQGEWITAKELLNFPCSVLYVLNRLWIDHSGGKFGFSVQQQIWCRIGGQLGTFDGKLFYDFGNSVGWRNKNDWLRYDDFTFSLDAKEGHLPSFGYGVERWDRWADSFPSFFTRVTACLQQDAAS